MDEPKTLFDKLWNKHVVRNFSDGRTLLHIDTHFVQEVTSPGAFDALRQMSRPVRSPDLTFGVIDHSISTRPGRTAATYEPTRERIEAFQRNCRDFGIRFFDVNDPEQGIVHVVSPEFGMALPGSTFVCADSHTSTIGGIGALAWGIGTTQVLQVLATQMLIQRKPRTMSVKFNGKINQGVFAKDLILYLISQYGIGGGAGYAIEFSGPALESLPLEGRMTVCNMSIEFGGRNGMVAVDDATVDYVHGRRFAPQGTEWDKAVAEWKTLHSDPGAKFDKEIEIDCSKIGPLVSWGNTPAEVVAIDQPIPDPGSVGDPDQRKMIERAIAYMDLTPGKTIEG
ncbi:MAG TPA: aconitase family protein, partial [Stellaceae bacterium]|nr:aconitase family protein [Stellaceae bacterium]